jgi:hypothetical protein
MGYIASTDDHSFENMKRAIIAGSAMASFCVEEFGTGKLENLSKTEIEDRIQEFVKLTNFEMVESI